MSIGVSVRATKFAPDSYREPQWDNRQVDIVVKVVLHARSRSIKGFDIRNEYICLNNWFK
jgi:hypothetical protein